MSARNFAAAPLLAQLSQRGQRVLALPSQLALGFAQSPTFPVSVGILRTWLPAHRWGFANGVQSTGCQLGAAAAPAVIVFLMQRFGWQRALFWTALPALALALAWAWYVRDRPAEHPSISAQ